MKRRPQIPAIYNAVFSYATNSGKVSYIAHLIDANGSAHALGGETSGTGGGAAGHPDQKFWSNNQSTIKSVRDQRKTNPGIARIEIDCSLLPCAGTNGCLYAVPAAINEYFQGVGNLPLRIFSHRWEGGEKSPPGRVIFCMSQDGNAALNTAIGAAEPWLWVGYNNQYMGPQITVGSRTF